MGIRANQVLKSCTKNLISYTTFCMKSNFVTVHCYLGARAIIEQAMGSGTSKVKAGDKKKGEIDRMVRVTCGPQSMCCPNQLGLTGACQSCECGARG